VRGLMVDGRRIVVVADAEVRPRFEPQIVRLARVQVRRIVVLLGAAETRPAC